MKIIQNPPDQLLSGYQDPLDGGKYMATFGLVDADSIIISKKPLELTMSIRRDLQTPDDRLWKSLTLVSIAVELIAIVGVGAYLLRFHRGNA